MKLTHLLLFVMAGAIAIAAQTQPKPAAPAAATAKPKTITAAKPVAGFEKLPPDVPQVNGEVHTAFSLKYQDIQIGTGADAEPVKLYKVKYTGYRAADGVKFDSWEMHPQPIVDKDGKQVMGDDGKPKMGDAEPAGFPIGIGRMIPGVDQGFIGMKVGGKRRLFVPWQLAYGTHEMPDRGPGHPGIPAKSNLIFDVELVDMVDLPAPPNRPGGMPPGAGGGPGGAPAHPGAHTFTIPPPATPSAPATPPAAATPTAPPAPPAPAQSQPN